MSEARLVQILRAAPTLMRVLTLSRALELADWRIVSGAVYQTVWNALTGRPPDYGIKDYDLAYFDPDTSWDAEDAVIRRARAHFPPPLDAQVEVRNQARVHLWAGAKFGEAYPALASTDDGLTRYAACAHAVAVRLEPDDTISVAAPFGLDDVFALTVRPNPLRPRARGYADKAASAKARWPEITVVEPG